MSSTVNNELNEAEVERAVKALFKFEAKKIQERDSNSLLSGYAKPILVQVHLNKPIKVPVIRPVRVKIPHSLFDAQGEEHSICLFCRSCDKELIESRLADSPIEGLSKVVSIDQIKKHYKQFQDRKKLLAEHTNFVCDSRVFSQLINLLGKVFSRRNNHPIPVDMTDLSKLESYINKAVHNSTYMHMSGQVITLRLGYTSMTPSQVLANILAGVSVAVDKLDVGVGLGGVHSIHLKSSDSPALPIHFSYKSEIGDFVSSQMSVSNPPEATPKKSKKKAERGPTSEEDPVSASVAAVLALDKKKKKSTVAPSTPARAPTTTSPAVTRGKTASRSAVKATPAASGKKLSATATKATKKK